MKQHQEYTLDEFRELLGVPPGRYKAFGELNKHVIKPAVDEVNALAPFSVSVGPKKQGKRHRQVVGPWPRWCTRSGWTHGSLCQGGNPGDFGPGLKGLGPGGSILAGGEVIAAEVKEVVDLIVGGEKRCACLADLNRFICRSRLRVG
jgi:hypothetical protein